MSQPTLYDRQGHSYRKWQDDPKPGMFVSGKDMLLFFGKVVLLGLSLVILSYSVGIVLSALFGL